MSHMAAQLVIRNTRWRAGRVVAIAIAATATGLAWLLGRLAHVDYIVDTPIGTRTITLALTIVATVVAGLAGWVVIALLERYTSSPRRVWIALTLVVLALSIAPVFLTTANLGTQLMLTALHCVAAAVLIPALPQRHTTATRRR
jgi:peptidoglycan/LPS O-acetylase OafA/YrhL